MRAAAEALWGMGPLTALHYTAVLRSVELCSAVLLYSTFRSLLSTGAWRARPGGGVRGCIGTCAASLASSAACCQASRAAIHCRGPFSALSTMYCSSHSCSTFTPCLPAVLLMHGCCMFRLRSHGSSLFSSGVVRTHGMTFHCMPLLCDSQVFLSGLVHRCSSRNAGTGTRAALHMSRINGYCHHVNFEHAHLSALLGVQRLDVASSED